MSRIGAGIVVLQVQPPLKMAASHIRVQVLVLTAPLLIQLFANVSGKTVEEGLSLGCCCPSGNPGWSSWLQLGSAPVILAIWGVN